MAIGLAAYTSGVDASPWKDVEYPPLDIAAVSRELTFIWRDSRYRMERANGSPICVPVNEGRNVQEQIVNLLQRYDEGRTRYIKYLRDELVHLHNIVIQPIILPRP